MSILGEIVIYIMEHTMEYYVIIKKKSNSLYIDVQKCPPYYV